MPPISVARINLVFVTLWTSACALLLFSLLDYQSLWVDELMQLIGTRDGTLAHTDQLVRSGVGGVPLGWLPQVIAIHFFGYSTAIARLPSVLASIASCILVFFTAKELQLKYPALPVVLFSLVPMQFRYALEARPYALGLLMAMLATLLFIRFVKTRSKAVYALYVLTLAAAVLTQPFTLFTAAAHWIWVVFVNRERPMLVYVTAAQLANLYASPHWKGTIESTGVHFALSWMTPLMLLKEITGAGYAGALLLAPLSVLGFLKGSAVAPLRKLLMLCCAASIIGPLLADAAADYFIAIRQMIFALPPLILLSADWLSTDLDWSPRRALLATGLAVVIFGVSNYRWLTKPREDWQAGARAIQTMQGQYHACTVYLPHDSIGYYVFFEPSLAASVCPDPPPAAQPLLIATSKYASGSDRTQRDVNAGRRKLLSQQEAGLTLIEVFQ